MFRSRLGQVSECVSHSVKMCIACWLEVELPHASLCFDPSRLMLESVWPSWN